MTPELLEEIRQFTTRYGCGNGWTGTVGQACTYLREMMDELKPTRKEQPIARGVLDYFPLAIAAVANVSYVGNEQHNAGEPMHWAREKSTDHADCIVRHLIDRGKIDSDGLRHTAKVAWRALALLQEELEHALRGDGSIPPVVAEIDSRSATVTSTFSELMDEARKLKA